MPRSHGAAFELPLISSLGNPRSGYQLLYFKADGKLYKKTSAGVETEVGAGSSGSANVPTQPSAPSSPADGDLWYDDDDPGQLGGTETLPASLVDAKGDLIAGTAADTPARLAVGANKRVLTADSTTSTGLDWEFVENNAPMTAGTILNSTAGSDSAYNPLGGGAVGSNYWRPVTTSDGFPVNGVLMGQNVIAAYHTQQLQSFNSSLVYTRTWDGAAWTSWIVSGSAPELAATTDYVDTMPSLPSTGIKLFTRHRARRLPAFVGPTGQDSQLQPALFTNNVMRLSAKWAVAALDVTEWPAAPTTYGAAASAVTPSLTTTVLFDQMIRSRHATTAATANLTAGFRTAPYWHMSDTANKGGFHLVFRFGWNAMTSGGRAFIGLSTTNAALTMTADPTGLLNCFGFALNAADTSWRIITNDGTGTATTLSTTSANFPGKTSAADFYEVRLFAPSGNGSANSGKQFGYSIHRLNTGHVISSSNNVNTDLPAINTALAFHAVGINVTAAAISMDVQGLYSEVDN